MNTSLSSIKSGLQARIVGIQDDSTNSKTLKQLMNMGLIKGNVIEVLGNDIGGLFLLRKENSTFGISKELANSIFVKLV
ncbi:MAG: Fe2+ transport system protein FeoA [Rickettsiales bacterium]|jgi:Fe2+ transport system protein FeoA